MEKSFETEVLTRLTVIETKLDDYKSFKDKSEEAYNTSKKNEKDIEEINDKIKWITRLVISSVVTAILSVVVICIK